jgi:cbb3-type cytochrome c oxidase subunit III
MKIYIAPLCILAGITLLSIDSRAESLIDGDADAGKSKAVTCSACHGADGNSASPLWPNLAGQSANYTVAQIKAFREGQRKDPLMTPQAQMLSDEDINDVAVYFESLPSASQAVANVDSVDRGEALWRGGKPKEGVAACIACHGPTGRGNPAAAYPLLAGQHSAYAAKQLNDYAAGTRTSDGKTRIMRDIAERLSKEDIQALASYVQGLK